MPFRCCAAALLAVVLATTHAQGAPDLPFNLLLDPSLSAMVMRMHRMSSTFRNQCRLIGANRKLVVRVELGVPPRDAVARAECSMARYQYGRIEAAVRVWPTIDASQLLAHELEHVLEFAEGLNYRAAALIQPGHVWRVGHDHFETRRAIDAGERVADELARGRSVTEQ